MFSFCCKPCLKEEGELNTNPNPNPVYEAPLPQLDDTLLPKGEIYTEKAQFPNHFFDSKYIRSDEVTHIPSFTKDGLFSFITSIKDLPFELASDKDGIILELCSTGSCFTKEIPIIHVKYTISKSLFNKEAKVTDIMKALFDPEQRMKSNTNLKSCTVIDNCGEHATVQQSVTKGNFIISERETIEKHVSFEHDGTYYHYSSSVPDELTPIDEKVVRVANYFSCVIITDNTDNFGFEMYSQTDMKIKLPPAMMKSMLPKKMKEFQDNLIKSINALP